MRVVKVINETGRTLIGDHVTVAESSFTRLFGLLGRRGLAPGEGLWIRPSTGVHTVGMRFPIDVIGLDRRMRVVRMWSCLVPYRMTSVSWRLHSVLELPAGRIGETGVQVGDMLRIEN
ncbi:MAG TPA: DUF192 domain-containing protein [Granulicella sp.]